MTDRFTVLSGDCRQIVPTLAKFDFVFAEPKRWVAKSGLVLQRPSNAF